MNIEQMLSILDADITARNERESSRLADLRSDAIASHQAT